jgi:hypothetical protein
MLHDVLQRAYHEEGDAVESGKRKKVPVAIVPREDIPAEVMARLRKIPYFVTAYEPDGMVPKDFNQIPALLSTMKQFRGAMDNIIAFTEQTLSARRQEALSAGD